MGIGNRNDNNDRDFDKPIPPGAEWRKPHGKIPRFPKHEPESPYPSPASPPTQPTKPSPGLQYPERLAAITQILDGIDENKRALRELDSIEANSPLENIARVLYERKVTGDTRYTHPEFTGDPTKAPEIANTFCKYYVSVQRGINSSVVRLQQERGNCANFLREYGELSSYSGKTKANKMLMLLSMRGRIANGDLETAQRLLGNVGEMAKLLEEEKTKAEAEKGLLDERFKDKNDKMLVERKLRENGNGRGYQSE